jgi:hypothetical protein
MLAQLWGKDLPSISTSFALKIEIQDATTKEDNHIKL